MDRLSTVWQNEHLRALDERMAPLLGMPDGQLEDLRTPLHHIRIVKHDEQIHFYFVDPDGTLEGPMSRIDLRRPLHLIAEYTQAATLSLLWKPAPQRICIVGLAGGRLSLVLYHHMPSVVIDNIELDAAVGPLAERYFGITIDERQRLVVADARAFLSTPGQRYDIIVMDAFRDASDNLDQLATREFYNGCKQRLLAGGVLAVNMLASDPLFPEKVVTFEACFRYNYAARHRNGLVLLGNDRARFQPQEIARRAEAIQRACCFDFPFEQRAAGIMPVREALRSVLGDPGRPAILSDASDAT